MARALMERKFIVEVADSHWDGLTDADINNLCEQIDAVMSFAEQFIEDKLRGTKPMLFVRIED